jgi:uncharacterized protein YsxB (DUF464 family)
MIKIIYDRTKPEVKIEGHVGSGLKGRDLDASASILAYTLASLVDSMDKGVQVRDVTVELDEEKGVLISCEPAEDYIHSVRLMFDTICAGFDLLAQEYPDNVSYELIDEDKKGE